MEDKPGTGNSGTTSPFLGERGRLGELSSPRGRRKPQKQLTALILMLLLIIEGFLKKGCRKKDVLKKGGSYVNADENPRTHRFFSALR